MIFKDEDCIHTTRVAATVNGQGYMWLGEAIEAAQEGDVVRLYQDIYNIPGGNQFEAKGYTIDLNGYTLAVDDVSLRNCGYDTPVIFTDLSEDGTGTVKCNITVEDCVFLEIQKGTYDGEFHVEGDGSITIYGGRFKNDPKDYAADGVTFALNKASGYYEVVHTHRAGTEYMTDGRAHWLKCDDEDCPLIGKDDAETVLNYEIAFSSYEGPELKETLEYSEEAENGLMMGRQGKIVDGDIIEIDIPTRSINVKLSDAELEARPMRPLTRKRVVAKSLKAYASMVSSADKGAVRIIPE